MQSCNGLLLCCTTDAGNVLVVVPDACDEVRAVSPALRATQHPAQGACKRESAARVVRRHPDYGLIGISYLCVYFRYE